VTGDAQTTGFLVERFQEGPSGGTVFDLQVILDDCYAERRRGPSTGNPTCDVLKHNGLIWVAYDLERIRVLTAKEVKD